MGGSAKALAASDRTTSSASEDDRSSVVKKRDELMMSEPPVSMIAALSNSLHRYVGHQWWKKDSFLENNQGCLQVVTLLEDFAEYFPGVVVAHLCHDGG